MDRRRFLKYGVIGASAVAGCSEERQSSTAPSTRATATRSVTTGTTGSTAAANSATIYVDPGGSDSQSGGPDTPLATIQAALDRAHPGDTVYLTSGEHTNGHPVKPVGRTIRSGTPDQPITITGPADAVVRGPPSTKAKAPLIQINHSHIHVTGLSLNGLTDPARPGDPRWYRSSAVGCSPPTGQDSYPDYLRDVRILPSRVGNVREKLIRVYRTNHVEIGGFEVSGSAGVAYDLGNADGRPLGAIVSVGRSSNNFGKPWYPWTTPDESHDIRIHDIGNLDGYYHTEFVETHPGNYDVTVEYCTDRGGGVHPGVLVSGAATTVRWNDLRSGMGPGVFVYVPDLKQKNVYEAFADIPDTRFPGRNNDIYGNRIRRAADPAIAYESPDWINIGPADQRYICGNDVTGDAPGEPEAPCPSEVPSSDKIGYVAGDSS